MHIKSCLLALLGLFWQCGQAMADDVLREDLSKETCEVAAKRIEDTSDKTIRVMTQPKSLLDEKLPVHPCRVNKLMLYAGNADPIIRDDSRVVRYLIDKSNAKFYLYRGFIQFRDHIQTDRSEVVKRIAHFLINTPNRYDDVQPSAEKIVDNLIERAIAEYDNNEDYYKDGKPVKIAIFIHGGLVDKKSAYNNAQALAPYMIHDHYVPAFLGWDSSFFSTYGDRLCCVTTAEGEQPEGFEKPLVISTRLFADIGSGIAQWPTNLYSMTRRQLLSGSDYFTENEKMAKKLMTEEEYEAYLKKALPVINYRLWPGEWDETQPPPCVFFNEKYKAKLCLINTNMYDMDHADPNKDYKNSHVVSNALSYPARLVTTLGGAGIGSQTWGNMMRRTQRAFSPCTFREAVTTVGETCLLKGRFGAFFTRLNDRITYIDHLTSKDDTARKEVEFKKLIDCRRIEFPENIHYYILDKKKCRAIPIELEIYGHSMGGIVTVKAIKTFPDLPWCKIVFMASAAKISDLNEITKLYGQQKERHCSDAPKDGPYKRRIYNLMLHPWQEANEIEFGGLVPKGSLLAWVDEMFEQPRYTGDLTMGRYASLQANILSFDPEELKRISNRVFPYQDRLDPKDPTEKDYFKKYCAPVEHKNGAKYLPICHPVKHGDFTDYTFWRATFLGDAP